MIMLIYNAQSHMMPIRRPSGYERVYLPLCQVADTPFHVQGGLLVSDMSIRRQMKPILHQSMVAYNTIKY